MLYKATGILQFNPEDVTQKHREQSEWKRVGMIMLNSQVDRYYAWFVNQRFGLNLHTNLRGSHVTFISDRLDKDVFERVAAKYEGKEVTLYYSTEPFTNGKHWWLRVFCTDIEPIREEMGLEKYPYFGIHLTLGRVSEVQKEHAKYIVDMCKFHNLLHDQPRKPFNDYIIVNDDRSNNIEDKKFTWKWVRYEMVQRLRLWRLYFRRV